MTIDVIPIESRDQWLGLRQHDVTASAAGALLGVHDYLTAFELWALKTGKIADDPEVTPAMQRGTILEGPAFALLKRDHPELRVHWNGTPGEVDGDYYRDPLARIGATPDCFAESTERGGGILQVKSVESSVFRRKWVDPDTREITPPLWIAVQTVLETHLTGRAWGAVVPLVIGHGIEMPIVEVPLHAGIVEKVKGIVADFWRMIAAGEQPDADYRRDGEVIARLFDQDDGDEIDLSHDNTFAELVARRATLRQGVKGVEADMDTIDNEVKARLGNHATAVIAGGKRVTWKVTNRKGYQVAPTSFRQLRYPRAAQEAAE